MSEQIVNSDVDNDLSLEEIYEEAELEESDLNDQVSNVVIELCAARSCSGSFHSVHEGLGVITEEYFEFVEAVRSNDINKIRDEATQLSAMALNILIDFKSEE